MRVMRRLPWWWYVGVIAIILSIAVRWSIPSFAAPDPAAIKVQGPDTFGTPQQCSMVGVGAPGSTQTAISSSATGANAAQTATLAGTAGKTTYIAGVVFSSGNATAIANVTCTITGTISGTLNFSMVVMPGGNGQTAPIYVAFIPPLPASAVNTSIVCTMPAVGAGNTTESVAAWGFQQ